MQEEEEVKSDGHSPNFQKLDQSCLYHEERIKCLEKQLENKSTENIELKRQMKQMQEQIDKILGLIQNQ